MVVFFLRKMHKLGIFFQTIVKFLYSYSIYYISYLFYSVGLEQKWKNRMMKK